MTDLEKLLAAGDALADAAVDVRDDARRRMALVYELANAIVAWRALAREVRKQEGK